MRTYRRSLIAATVVALAVGPAAPAAGQSDEPLDPMGASFWTGSWTGTGGVPGERTPGPGYTEILGAGGRGEVTADDPRITGTLIQVGNVRVLPNPAGEGDVGIVNGTVRIDNDAGAWVGTYTAYGGQPGSEEWYVMEGAGAYEGLTTVFRWLGEDGSFQGAILPAALPALPGPVPQPRAASTVPPSTLDTGGQIMFARYDADIGAEGPDLGTFIVDPGSGDERELSVPSAHYFFVAGWSPDGDRLLVNEFGPSHIRPGIIDAHGGDFRIIDIDTDLAVGCDDWSPDGTTLLCWAEQAGHPEVDGIYTVKFDGTDLTRLTTSPYHHTVGSDGECGGGHGRGVYSPDGSQIAFIEQKCGTGPNPSSDESAAIVRMDSDGTNLTEIVPQGGVMSHPGSQLSWSPDGSLIVFNSPGGQISVVRPDGTGLARVPIEGGWSGRFATAAEWSPDASRIVFSMYDLSEGTTDLYAMVPDGSGLTRVTDTPGAESWARWAPSAGS